MDTPREKTEIVRVGSPDHMWLDDQTQQILLEHAAVHTEGSEEITERMTRVAEMLTELEGASPDGLDFVVRVERIIREYKDHYGDLVNADPENAKITLPLYAMERMAELTADRFEEFDDLNKHV